MVAKLVSNFHAILSVFCFLNWSSCLPKSFQVYLSRIPLSTQMCHEKVASLMRLRNILIYGYQNMLHGTIIVVGLSQSPMVTYLVSGSWPY